MSLHSRAFNLAISLDQFLFCVITLGKAMPDETASAAAYRGEKLGHTLPKFFRPIIDWVWRVVFRDPDHCRKAYVSELLREQSP